MAGKDFSPDRRNVLKNIGVAGALGATGTGAVQAERTPESVSVDVADDVAQRKETEAALRSAGIQRDDLRVEDAEGQKVGSDLWVNVPVDDDGVEGVAYNVDEGVVEIKQGSNIVRNRRDADESVEDLRMDDRVVDVALDDLRGDADWRNALDEAGVESVTGEEAAGHVDATDGTTRLVLEGTGVDGSRKTLIAELSADHSLESLYGFDPASREPVLMQSAIDCWVECIPIGFWCRFPCSPCVGDPTRITCVGCAGCVGAAAAGCAAKCGIEQFW
jgi:hypothetical protein